MKWQIAWLGVMLGLLGYWWAGSHVPRAVPARRAPARAQPLVLPPVAPGILRPFQLTDTQFTVLRRTVRPEDLTQPRLFICGEFHGVGLNQPVQAYLLRFFHRYAGVRVVVLEQPFSVVKLAQRYLGTGHRPDLDTYLLALGYSYSYTQQQEDFIRQLHHYNQAQPEADRLRLVGLDLENQFGATAVFLHQILPDSLPPALALVRQVVDSLDRTAPSLAHMKRLAHDLDSSLQHHSTAWASALPAGQLVELRQVSILLSAQLQIMEHPSLGRAYYQLREAAIVRAFRLLADHLPPTTKFFGQWGQAHVFQHSGYDFVPWPTQLHSQDSTWAGRVLGLGISYHASQYRNQRGQALPIDIETDWSAWLAPTKARPTSSLTSPTLAFARLLAGAPVAYLVRVDRSPAAQTWAGPLGE
jgi:Erythromycin esterase